MTDDPFVHPPPPRRKRPAHPDGWQPGIDTAAGIITSDPAATPNPPDWHHVLDALGLDPDRWDVDGDTVQIRSWDVPGHGRQFYHRATVRPSASRMADVDFRRLARQASRLTPITRPASDGGTSTLIVALADWQAGKAAGGGHQQLVRRVHALRSQLPGRVRTLRKLGVDVGQVALLGLGDLIESCDGHYAQQTFDVELDLRQQVGLVRRLLMGLVDTAVKCAPQVLLAAVPGNHGENRRGGKSHTSWGDNWDVAVPEQVGDICAHSDRYQHVRVQLPDRQSLTLTVDLSGTMVGLAHGHQFRTSGAVQRKALNWWKDKSHNRHLVGDADLLLSAHFHHLQVHQEGTHDGGTRTWMQCPTLDGGSPWWEHMGGAPTSAGTLTVVVGGGGWSHLEIMRG